MDKILTTSIPIGLQLRNRIEHVENSVEKILAILAVSTLVVMSFVVLLQIFSRLFLTNAPVWTEELSRYLFIYTIAFGIGLAYKQGEMISVEIVQNYFKGVAKKVHRIIFSLSTLLFCLALIPYAITFMNVGRFQLSSTMFFPMKHIFMTTVIIFCSLAFFSTTELLKTLLTPVEQEDN